MTGWLFKKGQSRRNWLRRFFTLTWDNRLCYGTSDVASSAPGKAPPASKGALLVDPSTVVQMEERARTSMRR